MPTKHMGTIDSDKVVGRYLDQVAKYAVVTDSRVGLLRRLLRWIRSIW